jgi:hypothetical protein
VPPEHIQRRYRLSRIGHALLKGPFSLKPPAALDDYGWLECTLRIQWASQSLGPMESIAVMVDDSVNRDADFLPPLLRLVRWTPGEDYARAKAEPLAWPSVEVTLGRIRDWSQVQEYARELQQALVNSSFEPYGISAERGYPDLPYATEGGRYEVFTSNGVQALELATPALAGPGGHLTRLLASGRRLLLEQLEPFDATGWVESYPADLLHDLPEGRAYWRWEIGTRPSDEVSA